MRLHVHAAVRAFLDAGKQRSPAVFRPTIWLDPGFDQVTDNVQVASFGREEEWVFAGLVALFFSRTVAAHQFHAIKVAFL